MEILLFSARASISPNILKNTFSLMPGEVKVFKVLSTISARAAR
jgi:hypothetical protein